MPDRQPAGPVLILTPTGRDAVCAQHLLTQRGIACQVCPSLDALCDALDDTTGAVLVADEALSRAETARLTAHLSRQEPWSDLPFVVLTQPVSGPSVRRPQAEAHLPEVLGNVTLLERPLNALTLVSAVRSALRARQRQRQVRSHLTERIAAAEALRESEARFRAFVTVTSDVVYRMSPDWTEMRQLAGRNFLSDTPQPSADWMEHYIHPDDRPMVQAAIDEAMRTRSLFELEHRVRRADGTLGWTLSRAVPILNRNGEIAEWLGAAKDVTARREAEAALRESEERFRAMADTAPVLIWETDASGVIFVNGHYLDFFGVEFDAIRGMGWATFLHPSDAEGYVAAYREGFSQRRPYAYECRFRRADGQYRWLRNTGQPVGESRFVGCSLDVTDLQEAQLALRKSEERLKVLVAELQHRTRNLIGVVRAIADRTLASSASLDEFQDRFGDRLAALARVNGLLSRLEEDDRISFDELLQAELAGHGIVDHGGYGSQVVLVGPEGIPLRSSMVQTLALGLHELATNAVKYGALSRPEGRLAVRWSLTDGDNGERRLRVEWRESGVPVSLPPGGQPLRQGYGRELIERALPYQLSAETAYELTPDGVHCTITLPISTRHKELAHA